MPVAKVNFAGDTLIDLTEDTVTKEVMLSGVKAHDASGNPITGSMPNNGAVNLTIDGLNTTEINIPAGHHNGSGKVSLTDDIPQEVAEQAGLIQQIQAALEGKTAGGGGITVPETITAGDTPVLVSDTMAHTCTSTSATATGISITVPRAGTYRFKFPCARTNTSGTFTAQLYKNGTAVSGAAATWNSYQGSYDGTVQCNANDKIEIYATSRGSSYRLITGQLVACIEWETGF